jgi:hypothetical protein
MPAAGLFEHFQNVSHDEASDILVGFSEGARQ